MPNSSLHTIMLPVRGDGKGDNVLAHAAVLARKHGARVRVVHCRLRTKDLMSYGVVIPKIVRQQIEAAVEQNADVTEAQLLQEFRDLADEFGLKEQDHEPGKATARFIEYEGKQVDAVRHFGRLADLICVSQPDPSLNLGINTMKSALFSSGRPVMMCPHQESVAEDFADNVCIGWNGSLEASRAVALAMPMIAHAKSVTILSSGVAEHAASPEQLQRYLELRGVSAGIRNFDPKRSVVGRQLLQETKDEGGGVLIMGAYHDSFERESLFGGNSQVVVNEADFPIIMVH
ncbi:MAG: universal stress protein [Paracoccaceae bacterium]|nr:universal stress protein [Paracoccaceae bacterium]